VSPPTSEAEAPAQQPETPARTLKVCLINPRFEPSYWGFEHSLPMYPGDRRSTMINGALPTLAGLSAPHDLRIIDENVEPIDWGEVASYDVVGVTGMNVQRARMKEILLKLKTLDVIVAVGGPLVSVEEEFFDGLYDAMFVGESEDTWPGYLNDVAAGRPTELRYEQTAKTDMTKVPRPRYDLLKVNRYASGAVQFSRGCPFSCEFCDIIVIFGRRPRLKKPEQVIAELDDMRKAGFHLAMIVDDNFIGNKKQAKELCRHIAAWQKKHNYPLRINTEASLNLADDEELMELMYEANFRSIFIGVETPRKASLEETGKLQNTRGDSMEAKLGRIQSAGLDISAGFIVGFDSDDMEIFEDQYTFIQDNGILLAMVGMLGAIPRTPLYERLEKEGRLLKDDAWGCNFIPKQMTREQLQTNYWELVSRLYTPEAFLDRYFRTYEIYPEFQRRRAEMSRRCGEGKTLPTLGYGVILFFNLLKTLIKDGSLRTVGKVYWQYFWKKSRKLRPGLIGNVIFLNRCVTHWHFYKFTRDTRAGLANAGVMAAGMNG
jgi:radical SAM superfamily enzyme YgiQ (UPF0313 family)